MVHTDIYIQRRIQFLDLIVQVLWKIYFNSYELYEHCQLLYWHMHKIIIFFLSKPLTCRIIMKR